MRWLIIILVLALGGTLTLLFLAKEKITPVNPVKKTAPNIPTTSSPVTSTQTTGNKEYKFSSQPSSSYDFLNLEKLGEGCLKLYNKGNFSELLDNIENNKCNQPLSENEKLLFKALSFSAIGKKVKESEILYTLLNKSAYDKILVDNREKIFCRFIEISKGKKKYEQVKNFIFSKIKSVCLDKSTLIDAGNYFYKNKYLLIARRLYSTVYFLLNKEEQKKYYKRIYNLNDKIIFSSRLYQDSFTYTVAKGDILMKIGKKFSVTVELIKKINKLKSDLIFPGQILKIIKVDNENKFHILVKMDSLRLYLFLGEDLIREYPISIGHPDESPTPQGKFTIVSRLPFPTWKGIPYGDPANILGTRWLGFNEPFSNYGIHGTTEPETIGKKVTNGCIRMLNKDVEDLYDFITEGVEVVIQ